MKKTKIGHGDFKVSCETSLPGSEILMQELQGLQIQLKEEKISNLEYLKRKEEIEGELKKLIQDLCPMELKSKIDQFEFDQFRASNYDTCRFIPDVYFTFRISKLLSFHCMIKRRPDGIKEKIVAFYSKGLEAFSKILPKKAMKSARRIIFDDRSVFDEVTYENNLPIKFTELITSIVSRNNGSSIPIANNFIRSKYDLPGIPDHLPNYDLIDRWNIDVML